MADLSTLSDDQLRQIAGVGQSKDLSKMSDSDLMSIARGGQPNSLKSFAQNFAKTEDWSNTPLTGGALQKMAVNATPINEPSYTQLTSPGVSHPTVIGPKQDWNAIGAQTLASTGGEIADKFTAPTSLAFMASKPLVNAGRAVGRFATNLITGPEIAKSEAQTAKFNLSQQTAQDIATTQRIGKVKIGIAKSNADAASQGYDDLTSTMQKQVSKYADKQGLDIQSNLPKIFAQKSKEYSSQQDAILKGLSDGEKQIPVNNVVNDMENTLVKFNVLKRTPQGVSQTDAELTPTEQKILSIYKDLRNNSQPKTSESMLLDEKENPLQSTTPPTATTISAEDLIKNQKFIEPEYGKGWSPDDKLRAEVAKGFSNSVSEAVPQLQKLKSQYAPFLKWKEAAINKLQPFNNQYDVATGALSKTGSSSINPSEQRLIAKLQEVYQSPNANKVNALNKGIQQTALNKEQAAQKAQETIQTLRNNLAQDIAKIRQSKTIGSQSIDAVTNQLIKKYTLQRLGVAALGAGVTITGANKAIEYFIRNQVSKG